MRQIEYKNVLKPSVDCRRTVDALFLDSKQMAEFLKISSKVLTHLVYTDRVPLPVQLGLGKAYRWSSLELAEWVEARGSKCGALVGGVAVDSISATEIETAYRRGGRNSPYDPRQ